MSANARKRNLESLGSIIAIILIALVVGGVGGGVLRTYMTPHPYTWMLVGVMLTGGVVGGVVNYFLAQPDDSAGVSIWRSVFIGIGASFLVPLFLSMLSSRLMEEGEQKPLNVLYFFGFCLIAAISSKAFITSISARLLRQVEELKEVAQGADEKAEEAKNQAQATADEVKPIVAKETEPQDEDEGGGEDTEGDVGATEVDTGTGTEVDTETGTEADVETDAGGEVEPAARSFRPLRRGSLVSSRSIADTYEKQVVLALGSSRYTLRSTGGVKRDTGAQNNQQVLDALNSLVAKGLAGVRQGRNGELWYLTTKGRKLLFELQSATRSQGATRLPGGNGN